MDVYTADHSVSRRIPARIAHSPIRFFITPEYGEYCLAHIGEIIKDGLLGNLLCEEIHIDPDTFRVKEVVFLGTSDRYWFRSYQQGIAGMS